MLALGFGLTGNIEFGEDEIEELTGVHPGVEKESGTRIAVAQPVQETTLAGTGGAPELKRASGEGQDGAERSGGNARLPGRVHILGVGVGDQQHSIEDDALGVALRFQP